MNSEFLGEVDPELFKSVGERARLFVYFVNRFLVILVEPSEPALSPHKSFIRQPSPRIRLFLGFWGELRCLPAHAGRVNAVGRVGRVLIGGAQGRIEGHDCTVNGDKDLQFSIFMLAENLSVAAFECEKFPADSTLFVFFKYFKVPW